MCGFVGIRDYGSEASEAALGATVDKMSAEIRHRGPDDSGVWVDSKAQLAFGFRRLSILDLSPHGHQPMVSANGQYALVFNGEIYNHQEVRDALGPRPYRGHSDTEVLLAAIEQWGLEPALQRCAGMFALALWDRRERTLHLVRDRLGEKPLYYGWAGKTFLFGSELKALKKHPAWNGTIDRDALCLLLRFNYLPTPHSIFTEIRKLPPGSILTVRDEAQARNAQPVSYWSARRAAEAGEASPFEGNEVEAEATLEALLRTSVGQQLVADVPVGAFLSGGIDSSMVVAMMQRQTRKQVKTFTIGFTEEAFNEAHHARRVAEHLGTDHTELLVTPEQARQVIPSLSSVYDEPFADSSQIPTVLISQLARRAVTVSLSGDGADELLGGYHRYRYAPALWRMTRWIPEMARGALSSGMKFVPPERWEQMYQRWNKLIPAGLRRRSVGDKIHRLADFIDSASPRVLYRQFISQWDSPESVVLGGHEPTTAVRDEAHWARLSSFEQQMMYLDTTNYLPDDILTKVDRASMAYSLEVRAPYLDHRLVEFAFRLPLQMKVRPPQGKYLLRQLLYRYAPRDLFERPKKGFALPIEVWLRGPLQEWAEELLSESRLRREGYFDPAPIRLRWKEHLSGVRNWTAPLWSILMFQSWLEGVP